MLARLVCGTLLAALAGGGAAGGLAVAPRMEFAKGAELVWRLPLEEKLKKIVSIRFEAAALEDVVEFFRTELKLNVILDSVGVDQAGKLITLSLDNVEARQALDWVTRIAGASYGFRDGAVVIADARRLPLIETQYFRSYDVRDLANKRSSRSRSSSSGGGSGSDSSSSSTSSGSQDIARIIVLFTGPENWRTVTVLGSGSNQDDSSQRLDSF
ncbi:MAG TPA: hypothetical protein P5137_07380 [Candidatus Brocadiia bacterium]|nr:hypothetical protein [Candidatus Brocadiia bacterium]